MVVVVSPRPISPAQSFAPGAARAWATASYSVAAVTSSACSVWFRSWMMTVQLLSAAKEILHIRYLFVYQKERWLRIDTIR